LFGNGVSKYNISEQPSVKIAVLQAVGQEAAKLVRQPAGLPHKPITKFFI
jgi:hypothetical protein